MAGNDKFKALEKLLGESPSSPAKKLVPEFAIVEIRKLKLPSLLERLKAWRDDFRRVKASADFIEITASHPDPKIAEVGKSIETMLEEPLVKKFRRNKIHFFIDNKREFTNTVSTQGKLVIIAPQHFQELTADEIAKKVRHEMGHILRGDGHPRNLVGRTTRDSEIFADEIEVFLGRDPEVSKRSLDKQVEIERKNIDNLPDDPTKGKKQQAFRDYVTNGNEIYPSVAERKRRMDEMGSRISTPEKRSHVQAEIERRLAKEHDRVFGTKASYKNYPSL